MKYLNELKDKMEKLDENNNAAINGEDFIKEADEYSEETHSEDGKYGNTKLKSKLSGKEESEMSRKVEINM
jgi:hypothetical protein